MFSRSIKPSKKSINVDGFIQVDPPLTITITAHNPVCHFVLFISGLFCFFFFTVFRPEARRGAPDTRDGKGAGALTFSALPPPSPPWRSSLALALLKNAKKNKIKITGVMQAKSWVRKWLDFVKKFTVDGKSKSQFYWASCCCRNRAEMGLTDRRRTAKN